MTINKLPFALDSQSFHICERESSKDGQNNKSAAICSGIKLWTNKSISITANFLRIDDSKMQNQLIMGEKIYQ